MNIKNSTALVTGANRGIGRAIVESLLAQGARRIYAGARNAGDLAPLLALDPGRIVPLTLDVTDSHQIAAAAAQASDVNLLINNAGVLDSGPILDTPVATLRRAMDVNFYGLLETTRAFAPLIEANGGGAVVNLLTLVALASMPGLAAYNASKAAAWSITQSLRADLAKRQIQVFGVFPGAIDTDMLKGFDLPKTQPSHVASALLAGIENGQEDIFPDPMSESVYAAWKADHKAVERQFAAM